MTGETNLAELVKGLTPKLNAGEYVFVTTTDLQKVNRNDTLFEFKEKEGVTIVLEKNKADALKFPYNYIASWITLMIHSSLEAVGLTALFSTELAKHNISCNVVSGYYHDHIFVAKQDAEKAVAVLENLSKNFKISSS